MGEAFHWVKLELLAGRSASDVESDAMMKYGMSVWSAMTLVDIAYAEIEGGM